MTFATPRRTLSLAILVLTLARASADVRADAAEAARPRDGELAPLPSRIHISHRILVATPPMDLAITPVPAVRGAPPDALRFHCTFLPVAPADDRVAAHFLSMSIPRVAFDAALQQELGLTAEQLAKLRELAPGYFAPKEDADFQADVADLAEALELARDEQTRLGVEARLLAKVEGVATARVEATDRWVDGRVEALGKLLTADQLARLRVSLGDPADSPWLKYYRQAAANRPPAGVHRERFVHITAGRLYAVHNTLAGGRVTFDAGYSLSYNADLAKLEWCLSTLATRPDLAEKLGIARADVERLKPAQPGRGWQPPKPDALAMDALRNAWEACDRAPRGPEREELEAALLEVAARLGDEGQAAFAERSAARVAELRTVLTDAHVEAVRKVILDEQRRLAEEAANRAATRPATRPARPLKLDGGKDR